MNRTCITLFSICLLAWTACPPTARAAATEGAKAKKDGPKAKFFEKYDKNHNGTIEEDEKPAIRKDFAEKPDGDLKRFDKNNDGKLDDDEIAAIKPPTGLGKNAGIADFFAKYDKNHNGVIDPGETEQIRKDYSAKPNGDLKKFDKNNDGKLSDEEIAAIQLSSGKKDGAKTAKTEKSPDTTGSAGKNAAPVPKPEK